MAETDPYRHVPTTFREEVPEKCINCPELIGLLRSHNANIDAAIDRRKRTYNPVARVGLRISQLLSEARLYKESHGRILDMQDCEGTVDYPAGFPSPLLACGLEIRKQLSEQVTNQPIRTQ